MIDPAGRRNVGASAFFVMSALMLMFSFFFPAFCFGQEVELTPQMQLALTNERELAESLPGKSWTREYVAEAAARIASFPDQAACELLWVFASAPPEVDRAPVFAAALSSVSPRVRLAALAMLIDDGGEGARKMAADALAVERDPEVVRAAGEMQER